MRTRKIVALAAGALLALPAISMAKLVGQCSDCHTMHNSYLGAPVALVRGVTGASQTPNPVLLKMDCLSCHAQNTTKIVTMPGGSQIPQVYHSDPSGDLAGGNFKYVDTAAGGADRNGHNVWQLTAKDATLTVPPGFSRGPEVGGNDVTAYGHVSAFNGLTSTQWPNLTTKAEAPNDGQVTCAGYMGCHGWRNNKISAYDSAVAGSATVYRYNLDALTGAHHINDPAATGVKDPSALVNATTVGSSATSGAISAASYRFLWGVKGYGNQVNPWQNVNSASHNEYFGASGTTTEIMTSTNSCGRCHNADHGASTTALLHAPGNTMSGFCSTCHSKFHTSATNGTTGFVRHPSDYTIQNKTEYQFYTTWENTAPVARPTLYTAASAVVTPGTDMVMCLSCHEAHGTPNASMLRFDYTKMVAGNAAVANQNKGCFACHTAKDTGEKTW